MNRSATVTTPIRDTSVCDRVNFVPGAPKKKRACFRCQEEGHFGYQCIKPLRDVKPRCQIDLGKSLCVVVFPSKSEPTIHLRRYGQNDDKPTQDGIILTSGRWIELQLLITHIDTSVNAYDDPDEDSSFSRHLGGNWYVSVTPGYRCVDIRRFWLPEGSEEVRATREGIALGFEQWRKLMDAFDTVVSFVPELRDVTSCMLKEDHQNQLGALRCVECNPNDCMNW